MRERLLVCSLASLGLFAAPLGAAIIPVQVTIENLAPMNGTHQTPFWVGFHNGTFDLFNAGAAASLEIERLAEDGDVMPLQTAFAASGVGALDGVVSNGGPFAPGEIASMTFMIDTDDLNARYFSYGSMVVPSNDAFVANGNPLAHQIIDGGGSFVGADFFISGAQVWDAGTEVNDEVPMNTALFGQMTPNTGVNENGVVHLHQGYMGSVGNPGTPMILADPMFNGADFTIADYPIARITVTAVPAPAAFALLGLAGLAPRRRKRTD